MESGVHSSQHLNCHHQIIYTRFNLKIYYPPTFPIPHPHPPAMNVKSGVIKKWILI